MTTDSPALDGLIHGMLDPHYRGAPGISQSALKSILDCPARYEWERRNPKTKLAFDLGHVVHADILGVGAQVHVVDAADWRTKAAREEADKARAAGLVPLLTHEHEQTRAAAAAVRAHPLAGPMLAHPGHSEVAMFWADERTGIPCKGLADRVLTTADDTAWLLDVKTVGRSARPESFARDTATYGYHVQAAFYSDGWAAITGDTPRFLNVVVEIDAPHLVSVVELDGDAIEAGRARYADALDTYARCVDSGQWPGYTDHTPTIIRLPAWATR